MKNSNFYKLKLLILGVIFISLIGCFKTSKHYTLEMMDYSCYIEDELHESYLYREKKYDIEGRLIKQIDYNDDGTIETTKTYFYDKNGNETLYSRLGSDNVQIRYIYDEKNNLLNKILIRDNILESIDSMVYKDTLRTELWKGSFKSDNSKLSSSNLNNISFTKAFKYELSETYEFDSSGRVTKINSSWELNKPTQFKKYKYGTNGLMIEEVMFSSDGIAYSRNYKTYDIRNNKIDDIGFFYNSVVYHFKYEYDKNNNLIKEECIESNPYIITYEYDSQGKLSREIELNRNDMTGKMWKHVYKYRYLK